MKSHSWMRLTAPAAPNLLERASHLCPLKIRHAPVYFNSLTGRGSYWRSNQQLS